MRTKCGIVCEYNPFHNGHAYHIARTKEFADDVVCVMSGDFVQRAEPAIFDKRDRAAAALQNGADAVIQLPVVFSTAGARQFAFGAISILGNIKGLNYISFGIESCTKEIIGAIADIQLNEDAAFKEKLNRNLRNGLSYALSYSKATQSRLSASGFDEKTISSALNGANNVLAAEYIKAIRRKNLKIEPIFVLRCDKGYNDTSLVPPYASASAIRRLIEGGSDYSAFVPQTYKPAVNKDIYNALIRYLLLSKTPPLSAPLKTTQSVLDNKIALGAKKYMTIEGIADSVKSKAFTYAHIKRRILQIALNITKPLLEHNGTFHAKLLGVRESFKPFIKDLPDSILIKAADFDGLNDEIFKIDKLASDLYAAAGNQPSSRFYEKLICL